MVATLVLDDDGRPVLEAEDDDGNRQRRPIDPDEIPQELRAEYLRLLADDRDALEGGHRAEARYAYLWGIGAL